MSAISASRGAPRMPLPTRSRNRAAATQPSEPASGKIGLAERREAVAERGQPFAAAEAIRQRAGEHLDDRGGRFGYAFDDADRLHRGAHDRDEIDRQQRMDHLGGDVHQQRHPAQRPDADGNRRAARQGFGELWKAFMFAYVASSRRRAARLRTRRRPSQDWRAARSRPSMRRGEPIWRADHAKAPARGPGDFDQLRGRGACRRGGGPLPGDGPDRHAAQRTRRPQRTDRRRR